MVQDVAEFLGRPDVAVDDKHGPKLYSRFLRGLLEMPQANIDHSPSSLKNSSRSLGSPPAGTEPSRENLEIPVPPVEISPPSLQALQQPVPAEQGDSQMFDSGLGLQYTDQFGTQPLNAEDLYSPPLPFDTELLQSMQSLTNAASPWSIVIPGMYILEQLVHSVY